MHYAYEKPIIMCHICQKVKSFDTVATDEKTLPQMVWLSLVKLITQSPLITWLSLTSCVNVIDCNEH